MYDFFIMAGVFFLVTAITTVASKKTLAAGFTVFFSLALYFTVFVERDSIPYFKVNAEERNTAGRIVHERYSKKLAYLADSEKEPAFNGAAVLLELLSKDSGEEDSALILKELNKLSTPGQADIPEIRAALKAAGNLRIAGNQEMYDYFALHYKNSSEFHTKVLWPLLDYFGFKSDMPRQVQPWAVKKL